MQDKTCIYKHIIILLFAYPKTKGAEEFIAKVLVITVSKDMKSEM